MISRALRSMGVRVGGSYNRAQLYPPAATVTNFDVGGCGTIFAI